MNANNIYQEAPMSKISMFLAKNPAGGINTTTTQTADTAAPPGPGNPAPDTAPTQYAGLPYDMNLWRNQHGKSVGDWLEETPFPIDVFPECIRDFVRKGSLALGISDDFVATSVLTVAGAMAGKSRCLKLENGFEVFPNLFSCLLGKSGSGKSPAIRMAMQPISRPIPSNFRHFITHAHTTALFAELSNNSREIPGKNSILISKDELKGLFKSISGRGTAGEERENLFSLHDGTDISIRRITTNIDISMHRPIVAMLGGMVPSYLGIMREGDGEDGILGRFLFSVPRTLPVQEDSLLLMDEFPLELPEEEAELPEDCVRHWEFVIRKLYGLALKCEDSAYVPCKYQLDPEARLHYRNAKRMFHDLLRQKSIAHDESVDSILSKAIDKAGRLALILQLMHDAEETVLNETCMQKSGTVTGETFLNAIRLLFHFHVNSLFVMDHIEMEIIHERAVATHQYCMRNNIREISRTDACRSPLRTITRCADGRQAEELFRTMENMDLGEITKTRSRPVGGRPGVSIRLKFLNIA